MRKFLVIVSTGILTGLAIFIGLATQPEVQGVFESPLPKKLSQSFPRVFARLEIWKPNEEVLGIESFDMDAKAAAAYDLTTGRYTYEKNVKERLPMASITKIMTAVIALENIDLDRKLLVSRRAAEIGENSMGLSEGEKLELGDLLYGLILNSGNDAAETIAENSPFGRDNFIFMMNKKAEELGLHDTHFTNPSGLEGDGNQYTTVRDLIILTRYALKNPVFAQVVATYHHEIPYSSNHKYYSLYNETNLLTSYPGVGGVKTGYTDEAGLCLVTYLDYGGHKIIAVLLNATNRRQEMKDLLDYSLKSLNVKPPAHS